MLGEGGYGTVHMATRKNTSPARTTNNICGIDNSKYDEPNEDVAASMWRDATTSAHGGSADDAAPATEKRGEKLQAGSSGLAPGTCVAIKKVSKAMDMCVHIYIYICSLFAHLSCYFRSNVRKYDRTCTGCVGIHCNTMIL